VITQDLRHSLSRAAAAAGLSGSVSPGLRPTGIPGQYAASVALALGPDSRAVAENLAAALSREPWIETTEVTGPGYLTITVTPAALAAVAERVTAAGPACVTSDALAGRTVPAAPAGDPLAAPSWEKARVALAAQLTARLAAAAGATVAGSTEPERERLTPPAPSTPEPGGKRPRSEDLPTGPQASRQQTDIAAAIAFAGRDAVTFTLARAVPGKLPAVDPRVIARRLPGNPAYAVRYAHARAASGVRWAAATATAVSPDTVTPGTEAARPCLPADPGELVLLDALSWLPERVATAARRGRPDEFTRYLEELARVTVDVLSSARGPDNAPGGNNRAPGSDRLALARAARTGLAAGLGLLGVSAPGRL
jgi:arginyl-tRNA synthetase